MKDNLTSQLARKRINDSAPLTPPIEILPRNRRGAYKIRDELISIIDEPTVGWKLGAIAPEIQVKEGYDGPIPGRILSSAVYKSGETISLPNNVTPKVECEIGVRLLGDIDSINNNYDDLLQKFIGFDIAASSYATQWNAGGNNKLKMCGQLADNGNGLFIVVGPNLPQTISLLTIQLLINDVEIERITISPDIMPAINWIINHSLEYNIPLCQGDIIFSGSVTIPAIINKMDKVTAFYSLHDSINQTDNTNTLTITTNFI